MTRTEIINHLIRTYKLESYLEIGVRNPLHNFDLIDCKHKIGLDPNPSQSRANVQECTSDFFFDFVKQSTEFDLIFIDGDHTYKQSYTDAQNARLHLAPDGFMVFHDVNPPEYKMATPVKKGKGNWCGEVWKTWYTLRTYESDLHFQCVNVDFGVGIVTRANRYGFKSQKLYRPIIQNPEYRHLAADSKEMLNLITPKEFYAIYKK
jgi:hypothetical protein